MKVMSSPAALWLVLVGGSFIACNRETPGEKPSEPGMISGQEPPEVQKGSRPRDLPPPGELPGVQDKTRMLGEPPPANRPGLPGDSNPEKPRMRAAAELESAEGVKVDGDAVFTEQADGVEIVVEVEGAPPGKKGVHIHERGDCSNIAKNSMGPHFAPLVHHHALPSESEPIERHLGDLGNIKIGADGKGRLEIVVPKASLQSGDANSFLGRAIVIHTGEDTGSAKQPAGGSGAPIACGVVERQT